MLAQLSTSAVRHIGVAYVTAKPASVRSPTWQSVLIIGYQICGHSLPTEATVLALIERRKGSKQVKSSP